MTTKPIKTFGAVAQSILPAGDQELLVDRPQEQEKVEVAGADQLSEVVAVLEEEHLDQAVEGEEAADEEVSIRPSDQPASSPRLGRRSSR